VAGITICRERRFCLPILAFRQILVIVDAKNDCASERRIRPLQAWFTLRTIFNTWAQETVHNCSN